MATRPREGGSNEVLLERPPCFIEPPGALSAACREGRGKGRRRDDSPFRAPNGKCREYVLQLAHVSRPFVPGERGHRRGPQRRPAANALCGLPPEFVYQDRDVLRPLA